MSELIYKLNKTAADVDELLQIKMLSQLLGKPCGIP